MAQNIYDDPDFFAGYSQLSRSVDGLDGAGEWPRLRTLLPSLAGARVIDLGCGFGWFARWARGEGAASVLGIDVSEKMLERARRDTDDSAIEYRRIDLDEAVLQPRSADLVYSSLALHYVRDLSRIIGQVAGGLVPGGSFVCSIEHPMFTAPSHPHWSQHDGGEPIWPLDGYSREGLRTTEWLADGVQKYHRTIQTYVTAVLNAGMRLTHLVEWSPTDDDLVAHPDWNLERERCPFLFVGAVRES